MLDQPITVEQIQAAILQRVTVPRDLLVGYAMKLQALQAGTLTWQDIVSISKEASLFMQVFQNLSIEDRKAAVQSIVDMVIDNTDTPFLPDNFTDPIFKAVSRPIVDLFVDKIEGVQTLSKATFPEQLSLENAPEFFKQSVSSILNGNVGWTELFSILSKAVQLFENNETIPVDEKRQMAKELVDQIIDNTDTPLLPDDFSDPVFKSISHAMIDELIM
jgi:non-homologous end joining protein Ku